MAYTPFGFNDEITIKDEPYDSHGGSKPKSKLDKDRVKSSVSLKAYAEAKLDRTSRGELICPCCGSGTGPKKTPAFSITRGRNGSEYWKCFSCGEHGDIFELAGRVEGLDKFTDQVKAVAEWGGVSAYADDDQADASMATAVKTVKKEPDKPLPTGGTDEGREKNRAYIRDSLAQMGRGAATGLRYLESRGFTSDEIAAYGCGYDLKRKRVVIPFSTDADECYWISRDVTGEARAKYLVPSEEEAGPKRPFHLDRALDGADASTAVWVVEGVLDVMAIEVSAEGSRAVACCGKEGGAVASALIERRFPGVVLVNLDRDEHGVEGAEKLADQLEEAGVLVYRCNTAEDPAVHDLPGGANDMCEVLQADDGHDQLEGYIHGTEAAARSWAEGRRREVENERYTEALKRLKVVHPVLVLKDIYTLESYVDPVPTGLAQVDEMLDGGLYPGVYVIGAISSMGKTTLLVQIADAIASSGRPVLFVTIEQGAAELIRKSMTRMMWEGTGGEVEVESRELARKRDREAWGEAENAALRAAAQRYEKGAGRGLRYMEGYGQPGVSDIKTAAAVMASHYTGRYGAECVPVVMVDYLQLLRPENERDTDKQTADKNMMGLRQLARDLKTPVVVVSSLNRASYNGSISLDSWKESGGIEYGADVLLGLQPYNMKERIEAGEKADDIIDETKREAVSEMEVKLLKQREGRAMGRAALTYRKKASVWQDGCSHSTARYL